MTVDSNVGDLRQEVEKMKGMTGPAEPGKKMGPFTEFTLTSHDPALNWEDLTWLKEVAGDVPIYMKGVASIEVGRKYRDQADKIGHPNSERAWSQGMHFVEPWWSST